MSGLEAVAADGGEAGAAPPAHTRGADLEPAAAARGRPGGRALKAGLAAAVAVIALLVFAYWLHYRATHVNTVDSRIAAREVAVSSEVAGRVTAIEVVAGDRVAAGDLLVSIDTRQSRLALDAAQAELARIDAGKRELAARKAMLDQQVASELRASKAKLAAAEAGHRASEAMLRNVKSDYARAASLHEQSLISAELFEDAREKLVSAEQRERHAAADVETARAQIDVVRAKSAQLKVLDRQIAALEAESAAQEARIASQRIDLERRTIRARFDGVIDKTFVDVGEYVAPGRRLFMYHDPGTIWIDANFKETEFRRLSLGAPVTVTVDAYPEREFHGEVVRLGQAATSEFALLPSPNPSGNFTKVAQRLPVRISLAQVDGLLRPGMMVEVSVDVID
ncbi:MAG TPA: HlyD family secretion protein [Woeseiaceae bacterium]|nr:HlyD family secretion protein [Woeseiaceae bacterium]